MSSNSNQKLKRNFFEAFAKTSSERKEKKQGIENTPDSVLQKASNDIPAENYVPPANGQDDESTDFKLAVLASLQPNLSPNDLLELLLTCEGSVEEACELASSSKYKSRSLSKDTSTITSQSSMSKYLQSPTKNSPNPTSQDPIAKKIPFPPPPIPKGKTVHITTPEQVPYFAPATLHTSFLTSSIANQLLNECLDEVKTFPQYEFRLFDRNVVSQHTSCFYVTDEERARTLKRDYMYNGSYLEDVRVFTPTMQALIPVIEKMVNDQITDRVKNVYPNQRKLKHMLPEGQWRINTAFMNCYDGAKQTVGWHSDTLTYLGPRTIIASLSLGVEREFRLRRVAPFVADPDANIEAGSDDEIAKSELTDSKKQTKTSENEGQISLHLPHNSLLIMHAECQESYKHSVHPASVITPHPISKNKRINITFRCYRDCMHPNNTPRCKCGIPCVLRTVQRKENSMGRYFWMCYGGNVVVGEGGKTKGCEFFKFARFDEDGDLILDDGKEETQSKQVQSGI